MSLREQRIDQGVVQFEGLVDDEGDEVEKAVFVGAARDLGNLSLDDRISVITDAFIAEIKTLHERQQIKIERLQSGHIRQIGAYF